MGNARKSPRETIETRDLTNRELILDIYCQAAETTRHLATINGTIVDHNDAIYGNPDKHLIGVKEHTLSNCHDIQTFKTVWKTLSCLVGVIATGNLVAWITVLLR